MADDGTKALLRQVLDFLPTLATKADVAAVDAKIDAVTADLAGHRIETRTELRVLSARLDEQRLTINAMVSTPLAAVPPQRQAG